MMDNPEEKEPVDNVEQPTNSRDPVLPEDAGIVWVDVPKDPPISEDTDEFTIGDATVEPEQESFAPATEPVVEETKNVPTLTEEERQLVERIGFRTLCNNLEKYEAFMRADISKQPHADAKKPGTLLHNRLIHAKDPLYSSSTVAINTNVLDKLSAEQIVTRGLKVTHSYPCKSTVTGREARLAFAAQSRGLFRLNLYNTGIFIDMIPPIALDLASSFEMVDQNYERIGKLLGEYTFMFIDILFKEAIIELLSECVIHSNLKDWDQNGLLLNTISANDYQDIVMAFVAMSSPNRTIQVDFDCIAPDCGHHFSKDYLLTKFQHVIHGNSDAIEYMGKYTPQVTLDEVKEYQKLLPKQTSKIKFAGKTVTTKVPTLTELIQSSRATLGELEARLGEEPTVRNRKARNLLLQLTNHNFVPWIREISGVKKSSSDEIFSTTSTEEFAGILDMEGFDIDSSHEQFLTDITNFILLSDVTVIGYPAQACPKCGDIYKTSSGYVSWDPSLVFFETIYRVLIRASYEIEN